MSATYIPIQSTTLSSNQASVTFSNIPQTYTDLVIRGSARQDTATLVFVTFNNTNTNYSFVRIQGTGSGVFVATVSNTSEIEIAGATPSGNTANTFSSFEMYLPNYTVSQNKPSSTFAVTENNNTSATMRVNANLWRNTSAITSITLAAQTSFTFQSGSTFHLYGISNA